MTATANGEPEHIVEARATVRRIDAQRQSLLDEFDRLGRMRLSVVEAAGIDLRTNYAGTVRADTLPARRHAQEGVLADMYRRHQVDEAQYQAGQRVLVLLDAAARGQSVCKWLADGSGGGGSRDAVGDGLANALDMTAQWGMLTSRILMDTRCGPHLENRQAVIAVVRAVCHEDQSIGQLAGTGAYGKRAKVGKMLRLGLTLIAEALGDLRAHRSEANQRYRDIMGQDIMEVAA